MRAAIWSFPGSSSARRKSFAPPTRPGSSLQSPHATRAGSCSWAVGPAPHAWHDLAMSLATRCTSCGTAFRVVQDQLKVSEGWVRCGRCDAVFNALEGLFDLGRDAPPDWEEPVEPLVASFAEPAAEWSTLGSPADE